jgi:hypothetical protein
MSQNNSITANVLPLPIPFYSETLIDSTKTILLRKTHALVIAGITM